MKTWRWHGLGGAGSSGPCDRQELSTARRASRGTVKPSSSRPFSTTRSISFRRPCVLRQEDERRRRTCPARAGRCRAAPPRAAKKRAEIWTSMPAPSPTSGSAPTAPRCSRFSRIGGRSRRCVWDFARAEVDDEADAAGIVLARRVVEPGRHRPRDRSGCGKGLAHAGAPRLCRRLCHRCRASVAARFRARRAGALPGPNARGEHRGFAPIMKEACPIQRVRRLRRRPASVARFAAAPSP